MKNAVPHLNATHTQIAHTHTTRAARSLADSSPEPPPTIDDRRLITRVAP